MELTKRQAEIMAFVARGVPDKVIAAKTGLAVTTVRTHVRMAAARVPGDTSPRHRLTLFFLQLEDDGER